jgi:hypothetical protein
MEESSSGASVREHFHQSTALITTTSFMSVIFFDSFYESSCVCENPHFSSPHTHRRKSSDRCISTAALPLAHFILGKKASTVRQRVISAGESQHDGNRYRT